MSLAIRQPWRATLPICTIGSRSNRSLRSICFHKRPKSKSSQSCNALTLRRFNALSISMTPPKVLVADAISQRGIDELSRDSALEVSLQTKLGPEKLIEIIPEFAALIVRSETKVTGDILKAAKELRVVGRAGVGVDNVDVETATRRGVLVLNAPGGNTVSTAEHAF